MNRWSMLVALLALGLPPRAASSADEPGLATLDNGASVGFALLRAQAGSGGARIGESVFPHSNSVNRVLVDEESGKFFGYRLEVATASGRKYRVAVKPLGEGIEKRLNRSCADCPQPTPLGPLPRYPAPRILEDGDLFTLDLLQNPSTGERIVDAIRVSSKTITWDVMRAAATRLGEALAATHRADVFRARKNYAAAVEEFERAIAINANDAATRNKLGMCLQNLGRASEAEKQYREALRLNPAHAEAWNNLGTLQHSRGQFKEAIKSYKKAVSARPESAASALRNMGVAYFAQRKYDAGFEAFQAAYKMDPKILEVPSDQVVAAGGASVATQTFYFAKICAAAGQRDAAIEHLRKAVAAGFREFGRVANDPDLRGLVSDPRYKQLVRDARR